MKGISYCVQLFRVPRMAEKVVCVCVLSPKTYVCAHLHRTAELFIQLLGSFFEYTSNIKD